MSKKQDGLITSCISKGKSAFDWDIYKNRKSALQFLKKNRTLVNTILQPENGSTCEYVHSQVMSALSAKLTAYLNENGTYLTADQIPSELQRQDVYSSNASSIKTPGDNITSKQAITKSQDDSCVSSKISNNIKTDERIKIIKLPKFDAETLTIIVDCAYTGYLPTSLSGVWKVLDVADYYEMFDVIKAVCIFLIKNLNQKNCVQYYHIGLKHKHELQRHALHKIKVSFKSILASNIENIPGFFALPKNPLNSDIIKQAANNIASLPFEHLEQILLSDRLNVDDEESVWHAIRFWTNFDLTIRSKYVPKLLLCIRFPRMKTGPEFTNRYIWKDPLILNNRLAKSQLAILDSNHRDLAAVATSRDGYGLPCAISPRHLKPRTPNSIPLAIGGWQQGTPTTLIESFDINCNMWFQCKHRIQYQLAYHGVEYINGLLYIVGGTDGSEIIGELFTFDPVSGECNQKPSMRETRCYVSTARVDNYLYALGGHNGAQRMKSVEKFDVQAEYWSQVKDMNVARSDASACVYDSKIYIAGGLNDQVIENSVEFFNVSDDTWTSIASMITPRTSFTLLLYQGMLLAIGGNNGSERLATVEQYDFVTKVWSLHSVMKSRRSTFSAASIDDDKLIVAGGYNGQTPFNKVELYDAKSRSWVNMQSIKFDRSGLKVIVVNDLSNAEDYSYVGHNLHNIGNSIQQPMQY